MSAIAPFAALPRGSILIYTTIMKVGPQSHIKDGLLGPSSIMVVHMEPLSYQAHKKTEAIPSK